MTGRRMARCNRVRPHSVTGYGQLAANATKPVAPGSGPVRQALTSTLLCSIPYAVLAVTCQLGAAGYCASRTQHPVNKGGR